MTAKRFTIEKDGIGQYSVSDELNQFGMPITTKMNCKIIAYALNELHEENEHLKHQLITLDGLYVSDKEDMSEVWRLDLFSDETE